MIRAIPLAAALLLFGCQKAPPSTAAPTTAPSPVLHPTQASDPAVFAADPPTDWRAPLDADHPWVGQIWSRADGWVSPDSLLASLDEAEVVLLGEIHDHPDHHRLQAWILAQLATPDHGVVFEHLNPTQSIEAQSSAELAERSGWASSGWPDFALYAPIFDAIYATSAQIIAGHPTRDQVRLVMSEGTEALPAESLEQLPWRPLTEPLHDDLTAQIVDSHCGFIKADGAGPMVAAQTFKDVHMARAILQAGAPAILIAGNGHVRADRGVPYYLDLDSAAVVMREVRGDFPEPDATPDIGEEADFVWFTPRRHDDDPCDRFR